MQRARCQASNLRLTESNEFMPLKNGTVHATTPVIPESRGGGWQGQKVPTISIEEQDSVLIQIPIPAVTKGDNHSRVIGEAPQITMGEVRKGDDSRGR